MVSDKRGGPGAVQGPRPVVTRPGSVNRGFASVDPERQREPVAEGGDAADAGGKTQEAVASRAGRARPPTGRGGAAQPRGGKRGREEPDAGEGGGAA